MIKKNRISDLNILERVQTNDFDYKIFDIFTVKGFIGAKKLEELIVKARENNVGFYLSSSGGISFYI